MAMFFLKISEQLSQDKQMLGAELFGIQMR